MKKFQLLLLFLCYFIIVYAQPGKPTKEQTVKYLNTLAQASIGKNNGDGSINLLVFNYTSVEIGTTNGSKHTWSNIPWQEFDSLRVLKNDKIILSFKMAMPSNYSDPKGKFESNEPEDSFFLYVSADKIESFKKGCLRLAEIAKEENKDPFKN